MADTRFRRSATREKQNVNIFSVGDKRRYLYYTYTSIHRVIRRFSADRHDIFAAVSHRFIPRPPTPPPFCRKGQQLILPRRRGLGPRDRTLTFR